MRTRATCPGCKEPMSPADVMCRVCLGKVPQKYKADMTRAYKRFAKSFDPVDKASYVAACRAAAVKAAAITNGTDRPRGAK